MQNIINPIEEFNIKRATNTTNSLRVTRKQSDRRKALTKVKQAFSFVDPTGRKIQAVLKRIETHVNDLWTKIDNINSLYCQFNPNWKEDPSVNFDQPNLIHNLSDLCKEIGISVPSTQYDNYNKWFENETRLIAEIKKCNSKLKNAMDTKVELWKILDDTEKVIAKKVEPWIKIGETVWKDPRFNGLYRTK